MKIFITGATGYIGSAVAQNFSQNNHEIIALARSDASATTLEKLGYKVVRANITEPVKWVNEAAKADVLIHCAQLRVGKRISSAWVRQATELDQIALKNLIKAARSNRNCRAIIYTSGISVPGDHGNEWIDEHTIPRVSYTAGSFHLKSEEIANKAISQGIPIVILRSSLPVAPGGTFAEFFLKQAEMGKLKYVGNGENFWPTIHMDDLTNAYLKIAEKPPVGETIIIADDDPFTMKQFSELLMRQFDHTNTKSAPKWLVSLFAGKPLANLLVSSYRVRNAKAKQLLHWKPLYPTFKESLQKVMSEYKRT